MPKNTQCDRWLQQLAKARDTLRWYAEAGNYQDGVPGEATLFGWEADIGKRAQQVGLNWDRLFQRLRDLWDEDRHRPKPLEGVSGGDAHSEISARAFLHANHKALSAMSWQGFTHHGKGAIGIASHWQLQDGALHHTHRIVYLPADQLLGNIPAGSHAGEQVRTVLPHLAPTREFLTIFYGQDLRHWEQGRDRHVEPTTFITVMLNQGDPPTDADALGLLLPQRLVKQ